MKKYNFNVIVPVKDGKFTNLSGLRNSIFLAGPCPRENYADDWRYEAFDILNELGFTGNVITPTNPQFHTIEKSVAIKEQIEWERIAMHIASAIVFWVPRDKDHPAMTTNIEFGEWYKKNNVFIGWPDFAEHVDYFKYKLEEQNKPYFQILSETLQAAVAALNRPSTSYFTADTHFSQQRTLELSRRPFVDITEMDLTMISNWNKTVTMNDIVYHAGDFIDPDCIAKLESLLSTLNFKELHWTLGNYDRKIEDEIKTRIARYCKSTGRNIVIYDSGECGISLDGQKYVIVHEPNDFTYDVAEDEIVLFGHIHGRSFAKRNGFDLAADYHQYTPISAEQVKWFANAMNYWDKNVYSDSVSVS